MEYVWTASVGLQPISIARVVTPVAATSANAGAAWAPPVEPPAEPVDCAAPGSESALTKVVFGTAAGLELTRRAVSATRIGLAFPVARHNHKLPLWAFELAVQKATNDVVPYTGDAKIVGMSLPRFWDKAFLVRNLITAAAFVTTAAIAIPSLTDAVHQEGPAGTINTRAGRQGALGLLFGGYSIAGMAYFGHAGHAEQGFLKSAFTAKGLGSWKMGGPALAGWGLIVANRMGAFDGLNKVDVASSVDSLARGIHPT